MEAPESSGAHVAQISSTIEGIRRDP
jgi:hypothetical protein